MAVDNSTVELPFTNVVANVAVPVDFKLFDKTTAVVRYGNARVLAVETVDYAITLNSFDYTDFVITPKAAMITKINALITADPSETNIMYVRRVSTRTSDFIESDAFVRRKIANEFDTVNMKIQELWFSYDVFTTPIEDLEALVAAASLSAATATAQAAASAASAAAALVSETNASNSATTAGLAATSASSSASAAAGSETNAAASAAAAAVSAGTAAADAATAAAAATTATTQAGIATTQAGIATTQAGIATTGANTATAQAVIATTQAGNAATSATNAANSAAAAAAAVGNVLVSAADTTNGKLNTKLTVSSVLVKSIGSPGGNETLNIDLPIATQAEAEAGTITTKAMTPQRVAQAIAILGGAGGAADRSNTALDRIYQSKVYGSFRKLIDVIATGFKGATDALNAILTGSSSNYTLDNANGKISPSSSFDAFTKVLLHFDGANGSTTITNSAGGATFVAGGVAAISTAASVFGGASLAVNGAGASAYAVAVNHPDLNFGAGDFTIDFRFRLNAVAGNWIAKRGVSSQAGYIIGYGGSATVVAFSYSTDGTNYNTVNITVPTITTGTFYHFEIGRNGATTYAFWNGAVAAVSANIAGTIFNSTENLRIGGDGFNAGGLNGYIDEFRISKGVCRHTAAFTPPAAAYGPTINNMTLVTAMQTAEQSCTAVRAHIVYDDAAALVLGTDFTIEVTANGGTNWSNATLNSVAVNADGMKVVETNDTTVTAGTSFGARVKTLTNKDMPIIGLEAKARA